MEDAQTPCSVMENFAALYRCCLLPAHEQRPTINTLKGKIVGTPNLSPFHSIHDLITVINVEISIQSFFFNVEIFIIL